MEVHPGKRKACFTSNLTIFRNYFFAMLKVKVDFSKFNLPWRPRRTPVLPRRKTRLLPASVIRRASFVMATASMSLAVLGMLLAIPGPTLQEVADSWASSLRSGRATGKLQQKLLLVSRDGLNLKNQDFSSLYEQEARCIEGLLAKGARAVGILQKDPATQREKFLRQKLGRTRGVVLFPVEGSFLKTFAPSDRRLEVRYPVGTTFNSFVSRMLKAAALPQKPGFVRVEIRDAVESPVLNLSHLQRILQDPKRSQELVANRLIVLTPHRDLTAWREWQCLQAVAEGKAPLPRPSRAFGILWTVLAVAAPSLCVFLPPRRDLRILDIPASFLLLSVIWLAAASLGGVSLEVVPWLAGWLVATSVGLFLAGAGELAFWFHPSLGTARLREMIQGPRLIPIPSCWKKPAFTPPLPRLAPLQKVAAEILLQALGRPKHSKTALQEFLKQYDAVTAVRLTLRN
jgi:hypothetical protein